MRPTPSFRNEWLERTTCYPRWYLRDSEVRWGRGVGAEHGRKRNNNKEETVQRTTATDGEYCISDLVITVKDGAY